MADSIRKGGSRVFAADQGTSLTSHGDGSPNIDEGLVAAREAEKKAADQHEKKLRDDADKLLKRSSASSSSSSSGSSNPKS